MPKFDDIIGGVVQRGPDSFLWAIPDFSELSKKAGFIRFQSPTIRLEETMWKLFIFPNGTTGISENMLLGLVRGNDGGPVKTFECGVDVRRADGEEVPVGCKTVNLGSEYVTEVLFPLHKRARDCVEGEYLSSDTLTIALFLREEGEAAEWQGDDYCTCGTQTEDLEDTEDESPEAKGMKFLTTHMRELFIKSDDCDIRFHVQGKEFPAHGNILKARCPVFCKMLTHNTREKKSGIIRIKNCDADAFEIFLLYLYTGKLSDIPTKKAVDVYQIAKTYNCSVLQEQCVCFLEKSLSKTTMYDVILFCAVHEAMNLMEAMTNFFIEHIDEILVTVEWQNFMVEHPVEANQLYIKYVKMSQNNAYQSW